MLNIESHRVAANNRTLAVCVPGGMSLLLTKGQRFLFRAIAASMAACNAPELKMLRTCWPSRVTIKGQYSGQPTSGQYRRDRKSTRLNSSHTVISYAVFCLKKKNKKMKYINMD